VISDIEAGKFRTQGEAMSYYGITGYGTITRWMKQFRKPHLAPKIVRIETMDEIDQIEALKKRIKLLEKALADTRLDQVLAEAYLESFCEEFGVKDIDALKKKLDIRRSKTP